MLPIFNSLLRSPLRHKNIFMFGQSILKLRRDKEAQLAQKIKKNLQATFVSVTDTTVGSFSCGQMYKIVVESPVFEGKSKVQQQRLVNEAISEQVKQIHGYSLKTRTPKKPQPTSTEKKSENSEKAGEDKQKVDQ